MKKQKSEKASVFFGVMMFFLFVLLQFVNIDVVVAAPINFSVASGSLSVTDNPVVVGTVATWSNAGTIDGQNVDLKATVLSMGPGDALTFEDPSANGSADDFSFLLFSEGTNHPAETEIRWEVVLSGTSTTASGDVNLTVSDIDGIGGNPNTRETVVPSLNFLTSYGHETPTNVDFSIVGNSVIASGTQNQNGEMTSAANFTWSDVVSWQVTYKLDSNALTNGARFLHDGDGDMTFTNKTTVELLDLDLDADDSVETGKDFSDTFVKGGSDVNVTDSDLSVSQHTALGTNLSEAIVELTNAQLGDELDVNGTLPTGITLTVTNSAGSIEAKLSGVASVADYETALKMVVFRNTSTNPDKTDRNIEVSVKNDIYGTSSNIAISTISIMVDDDEDDVDEDDDLDDDNDGILDTGEGNGAVDTDSDGIVDSKDLDSDNDGIPDNIEAQSTVGYVSPNGDAGVANNGVDSAYAGGLTPVNTDGADSPDFMDTDSDNEGDNDTVEAGITLDNNDSDGDGLDDAVDDDDINFGSVNAGITDPSNTYPDGDADVNSGGDVSYRDDDEDTDGDGIANVDDIDDDNDGILDTDEGDGAVDTDGDGTPDSLDSDSDNDGVSDAIEGNDANHDGVADSTPSGNDTDSDGLDDAYDTDNGGTPVPLQDTDNDSIKDFRDTDDDGDTIPTVIDTTSDTDTDGTPNYLDTDSDDDSASDETEDTVATGNDTDSDEIDDAYDVDQTGGTDANHDGVDDNVTSTDTDSDGTPDFEDTDSDNDGNPDSSDSNRISPVATNDSANAVAGQASAIDILANDDFLPHATNTSITDEGTGSATGTISFDATTGELTYTPLQSESGTTVTVDYEVCNTAPTPNVCASARVSISVNAIPTVSTDISNQVNNDGDSVELNVLGNFNDADGDQIVCSTTGLPTSLEISNDCIISGKIDANASQSGPYNVVVTANDQITGTVDASFVWTVNNTLPVANDDTDSTVFNASVDVDVLNNDSDSDGDVLIVSKIDNTDVAPGDGQSITVTGGNAMLLANGKIQVTASDDSTSSVIFLYSKGRRWSNR